MTENDLNARESYVYRDPVSNMVGGAIFKGKKDGLLEFHITVYGLPSCDILLMEHQLENVKTMKQHQQDQLQRAERQNPYIQLSAKPKRVKAAAPLRTSEPHETLGETLT